MPSTLFFAVISSAVLMLEEAGVEDDDDVMWSAIMPVGKSVGGIEDRRWYFSCAIMCFGLSDGIQDSTLPVAGEEMNSDMDDGRWCT